MTKHTIRVVLLAGSLACLAALPSPASAADKLPDVTKVDDLAKLPANQWTLIAVESSSGGKSLSRAVWAGNVGRLYLWGIGGNMPTRNRYLRYELESFAPADAKWVEALPADKAEEWSGGKFPPFTIYGQRGDAKGPPIRSVGNQSCNILNFHDFDGVQRPSPLLIFNQVTFDSKRGRLVFFAGGHTFALDPKTNTWTDLQPERSPAACNQLAWANMGYDPVNDEVLLFGGGDAMNLQGGASTWLYDCAKNTWRRLAAETQPPLRCTSPIVYDPATQSLLMFGGYNQQAALNDTWVYVCKERRWELRKPDPSPPPMFDPAVAAIGNGLVLVCEHNALTGLRTHSATRAPKETWVYDVKADKWTPVDGKLSLWGNEWLTADSPAPGVALLVAIGPQRRTYAMRYDASAEPAKLNGSPPGTIRWKFPDQKEGLEKAPPPDPAAVRKMLAELPVNQFVDAKPPAVPYGKTWSTAIANTDTGQILYIGGGHSGYSGNDWMHYDVATNRWSMSSYAPCFPPYLESSNGSPWGYAYNARPWSQHTYLWYAYDPLSKQVIYCARPTIGKGVELALDPDDPDKTFAYDPDEHGYWAWLYDPAKREMSGPHFGRPFGQSWGLALCTTPKGVYACDGEKLYRATVADGKPAWKNLGDGGGWPNKADRKGYHFEYLPIVYDSKRERLIHLMGRNPGDRDKAPGVLEMHVRGLGDEDKWQHVETNGVTPLPTREVVYLPKQDALLALLDQDHFYAFDCQTATWRQLDVQLPGGSYGHECSLDYDPVNDVVVATIPSGFSRPVHTLLFRYDPKSARDRKAADASNE